MASPKVSHQDLVGEIYFQLKEYLRGKRCRAFISALDVKLSGEPDDKKEFCKENNIIVKRDIRYEAQN